jgi:hypothetical protein
VANSDKDCAGFCFGPFQNLSSVCQCSNPECLAWALNNSSPVSPSANRQYISVVEVFALSNLYYFNQTQFVSNVLPFQLPFSFPFFGSLFNQISLSSIGTFFFGSETTACRTEADYLFLSTNANLAKRCGYHWIAAALSYYDSGIENNITIASSPNVWCASVETTQSIIEGVLSAPSQFTLCLTSTGEIDIIIDSAAIFDNQAFTSSLLGLRNGNSVIPISAFARKSALEWLPTNPSDRQVLLFCFLVSFIKMFQSLVLVDSGASLCAIKSHCEYHL